MSIEYKDYELLELFEDFPQIIDKEAYIVEYNKINKLDFKFSLFISALEDYIILTLSYKDIDNPIYEITFHNVEKLIIENNKLMIYEIENQLKATILFEPNFSLVIESKI